MGKIKVLYIASFWRSGTTILGNVLGEVNNFFHAGELWYLWNEGVLGNSSCGCGAPFAGCPVWSAVMNKAYGGLDNAEAQEMIRWRDTELRTRNTVLRRLLPGGEWRLRLRVEDRVDRVARLYHAIQAVTGCKVIVDSSKVPAYVHALRMAPSLDVYILHLVRDSRSRRFLLAKNSTHSIHIPALRVPCRSRFRGRFRTSRPRGSPMPTRGAT